MTRTTSQPEFGSLFEPKAHHGQDLEIRLHNYRMIVRTIRQSWHDCGTILEAHSQAAGAYSRVMLNSAADAVDPGVA